MRHQSKTRFLLLLALQLFLAQGLLQAADRFAPTIEIADKTLKKNGEALCEWGFFGLDLYRVALWVETPSSDPNQLLKPGLINCLELQFVRSLSQKQMREAYQESIKVNQPDPMTESLKTSLDQFINSVEAAPNGSQMQLICLPGKGLEVRQGKKKTLIPGDQQFLDLILKLYIGKKPPTPEIAKGLLGNHPKSTSSPKKGTANAEEKPKKVPEPDAPPS